MNRPAWLLSLILLLTFWTYYPSLQHDFLWLWDDLGYIIKNPPIWQLNHDSLLWMLSSLHMGNWHPLTWLSHALDIQLFGFDARGHHLVNILWHVANTALVFLLARRLLQYCGQTVIASSAALLTAALFGLHPQHVESVAWISERKDLLSLFFMLGCFYYYLAYVQNQNKRAYIFAILWAMAATLSKPMAVTLPVLLWIFDALLQRQLSWRLLWDKIPFWLLSLGLIAITLYAQQQGQALASLQQINWDIRLLNGLNNPIFYLQKFILPVPLVPFYPFPSQISLSLYMGAGATVLISILVLWAYRRGFRVGLWAWGFYLVSLSPVMGIIQVGSQAAADRYTYLPLLAIYLLLSVGLAKLVALQSRPIFVTALWVSMSMILLLLSSASRQQQIIWANDLVFWRYNVMNYPDSSLGHLNLAHAYRKNNNWQQAAQHYEFSAYLSHNPEMYYHWAKARQQLKQAHALLAIFPKLPPLKPAQAQAFAAIYAKSVRCLWMRSDLKLAATALDYASSLAPQSSEVLRLQQQLGRYLPGSQMR